MIQMQARFRCILCACNTRLEEDRAHLDANLREWRSRAEAAELELAQVNILPNRRLNKHADKQPHKLISNCSLSCRNASFVVQHVI
jgi:hypothetical protein